MDWDWNRYYEPDDCVVWKYQHDNPIDVLGRAIVGSSDNGVRVYCNNKDLAKKIMTKEKETFGFVQEVDKMVKPTKIIYSGRKTIVFWNDGTKTMVTRNPEDQFDVYTAFCAALAKKMFNTTSSAKRMVDKLSVFQNSREDNSDTEHTKVDRHVMWMYQRRGNAEQLVADVQNPKAYEVQPIKKSDLGANEISAVVNACRDFADSMANLGIAVGDISIKFGKHAANALKNAINNRKDENK